MNRERICRGKNTEDGVWVSGFYYELYHPIKGIRIPVIDESTRFDHDGDSISVFRIDPLTVGDFTGVTDKSGQKIFEDDIFQRNTIVGLVVYYRGCWFLEWKQNETVSRVVLADGDTASGHVIGNLHDNP